MMEKWNIPVKLKANSNQKQWKSQQSTTNKERVGSGSQIQMPRLEFMMNFMKI